MEALANLGIDLWSIVIYAANIGVLIVVLTYLLYKPILKFIDDRRQKIIDSIDEAQKLRDEFAKKLEKTEKEKHEVEETLRQEIQNLNKFVETKRTELIEEMTRAKTAMMEKAQKEIEERKTNLVKEAEQEILKVMTQIILDIVQNKVPEDVIQESIKESWKNYSLN